MAKFESWVEWAKTEPDTAYAYLASLHLRAFCRRGTTLDAHENKIISVNCERRRRDIVDDKLSDQDINLLVAIDLIREWLRVYHLEIVDEEG